MNVLIGDVTADRTMNTRDVRLTRDQIGLPVTAEIGETMHRASLARP